MGKNYIGPTGTHVRTTLFNIFLFGEELGSQCMFVYELHAPVLIVELLDYTMDYTQSGHWTQMQLNIL